MRWLTVRGVAVALLAWVPAVRVHAQVAVPPAAVNHAPPGDTSRSKSNALPALEIAGFLTLLSVVDRVAFPNLTENGVKVFSSTLQTAWDHLRTQRWEHDPDSFRVNQLGHPYQGSLMYGLARSSGHGFWTSAIHANVGSFLWEMAGETVPPSIDDLITTSQAGSLFGEALYRLADLVLKDGDRAVPNRLHEYGAALISPPGGLNRRIFGKRFKARLPDTAPATAWNLKFGASLDALARDYSAPTTLLRRDAAVEFTMAYGLPGQPGYEYTRPLDYFDMQLSVLSSSDNPVENLMIRGLLVGRKIAETKRVSGIWGLYGSYDYVSPFLFRVSTTALSLGTTREYALASGLALQGSALAGLGYGGAGSRSFTAATTTSPVIRDYHRGITPQALVALRFTGGGRATVDLTAREYYVSGQGSDNAQGSETIFRGSAGLTVRVRGGHALGVQYVASMRNAQYGVQPDVKLSEGTVTVSYSIIGGESVIAARNQARPR